MLGSFSPGPTLHASTGLRCSSGHLSTGTVSRFSGAVSLLPGVMQHVTS